MTIPNSMSVIGMANDVADVADPAHTVNVTPKHITGTIVVANGTTYTYVIAASAIAAAGTFVLSGAYNGPMTTAAGSTHTHDVAGVGVPSGAGFWARAVTSPFTA